MTDPIRFKLGLAGGLVTDAEGDWITYRTHVAAIARLTHERDALFGKLAEARVGRDVGDFDYPPGSAPCMCFFSTAEDRGPDPLGECDYHKALRARLAECERLRDIISPGDAAAYEMAIASQPSSADVERRPCTCHPDDNPPVPCPRMYALQDCRRAAALAAEIESLRARMADMQGERDAAELSRDAAHARLAEAERTIARLSGFKP